MTISDLTNVPNNQFNNLSLTDKVLFLIDKRIFLLNGSYTPEALSHIEDLKNFKKQIEWNEVIIENI